MGPRWQGPRESVSFRNLVQRGGGYKLVNEGFSGLPGLGQLLFTYSR